MSRRKDSEVAITVRIPDDIDELLKAAKRVTGASVKFLVIEALRTKYAKFAKPQETAIAKAV